MKCVLCFLYRLIILFWKYLYSDYQWNVYWIFRYHLSESSSSSSKNSVYSSILYTKPWLFTQNQVFNSCSSFPVYIYVKLYNVHVFMYQSVYTSEGKPSLYIESVLIKYIDHIQLLLVSLDAIVTDTSAADQQPTEQWAAANWTVSSSHQGSEQQPTKQWAAAN
jgi:hypothetical protein